MSMRPKAHNQPLREQTSQQMTSPQVGALAGWHVQDFGKHNNSGAVTTKVIKYCGGRTAVRGGCECQGICERWVGVWAE
jgi:hypothetical protein